MPPHAAFAIAAALFGLSVVSAIVSRGVLDKPRVGFEIAAVILVVGGVGWLCVGHSLRVPLLAVEF